jgi:hypothetical protein
VTPEDPARESPYLRACTGRLVGVLRWEDLDALWAQLQRLSDGGWYAYAVGDAPPAEPASRDQFERFLAEIRQRLEAGHKDDHCGIVYADDHTNPSFVKIFDPVNLGAVCGCSNVPTLPGWTLSRMAPDDLRLAFTRREGRRWWRRLAG